jgi:phosphopentomutase
MLKKLRTQGKIRSSVLFEAALIEDVALQGVEDIKSQRAVSGDIINHWWGVNPTDGDPNVKKISPLEAAQNLLSLSDKYDAVFFEHFYTDLSGHGRIKTSASEIVGRLDGFLSELIAHLPKQTLLLLTSDHGNFEDASHLSHTTNPVPFLALGKKAGQFSHVQTIIDIVPTYLEVLDDELKSGSSENQTKVA